MASARLQITVESASNLYNADGMLAGKSDPYVIVEVPGQENMRFQTQVINNDINPVWNYIGEIAGFMEGDVLQFSVMDKDTWPKPDDFLGRISLTAADFYPDGLHTGFPLQESRTNAVLQVKIAILGCDELGMEAVHVYRGFTEHTHRLVFPFEDKFAPNTPQLFTILPSGVVENSKVLEPKKEKGLIAFTYPQSISDEFTGLPVGQQLGSNVDTSTAKNQSNPFLRDTVFVWRRQDGTNALVQTWATNLNEKFRQDFEISEGVNPDSAKFQPEAVSEFQEAMVRLFGPAAASCPIWFCHKKLESTSPAVVGLGKEVLAHIKENPDLMRELAIASIDGDGQGFVADGTDGKGQKFEKQFRLAPGEQCVVYRKTGWDTMGCTKPLDLFLQEAEFHEPLILDGQLQAGVAQTTMAIVGGGMGMASGEHGTAVMAAPTTYPASSFPSQSCYSGSQAAYSPYTTTQAQTYVVPRASSTPLVSHRSKYSATPPSTPLVGQPFRQPALVQNTHTVGFSSNDYTTQTGVHCGNVFQTIVYPPRTVTAHEFAQVNGTIVSTPLPVTAVTESSANTGVVETVKKPLEKKFKMRNKKKSKNCCQTSKTCKNCC